MITDHKVLLEDKRRCLAYRKAISQVVRKGDIVADIGAGSGLLSFFALQAGARRVYAIEKRQIIEDAKKIARDNKFLKKIVFIKGFSTQVRLPEKVDLIISEIIGHFGINESIVRFLSDAKKRFLKKGGRIIPASLELYIAPVEGLDIYRKEIEFWKKDLYGIDFTRARKTAANSLFIKPLKPQQMLDRGALLYRIDFSQKELPPRLSIDKELRFKTARSGVLCGFCVWFKVRLCGTITLCNSPYLRSTHWQNAFLPIEKPLSVTRGQEVGLTMKVAPFYGQFLWTWEVKKNKKITLYQSSFNSLALSELLIL